MSFVDIINVASNFGVMGVMGIFLWLLYTGKLVSRSIHDQSRQDVKGHVDSIKAIVNSDFHELADRFAENTKVQREMIDELKNQRDESRAAREKMNIVITSMNANLKFLTDWLKEQSRV